MSLRDFHKAFGIKPDFDAERERFVERINQSVFQVIHAHPTYPDDYEAIYRGVCYELGVDPNPRIADANRMSYGYDRYIPKLKSLTGSDFVETLKVLVLLREQLHAQDDIKLLDGSIELALASASVDLGVRWKDGMFYPSGARELDEKLIDDNLEWLQAYSDVKTRFKTALDHFSKSLSDPSARKDAITNAYSAMEGLARVILGNKKSFEDNSNEIVRTLGLSTEYGNILHQYKQVAHEYSSRHAGSGCTHIETEAFIYLTGLMMRLLTGKHQSASS